MNKLEKMLIDLRYKKITTEEAIIKLEYIAKLEDSDNKEKIFNLIEFIVYDLENDLDKVKEIEGGYIKGLISLEEMTTRLIKINTKTRSKEVKNLIKQAIIRNL